MTSTSMASLISSLSTSFKQVPPVAIPSVLDCVLASTGSSPLAVFNSLIDTFHNFSKHAIEEAQRLGSDQCNYMASVVLALCHLLKKLDTDHDAFQSFTWKCFIPLMKKLCAFDHEMFNQIMESFVDVVIETNTWAFLEESLVPFVLGSVAAPTLGMLNTEGSDNVEQDRSFPLLASCCILSLVLDAALRSFQAGQSSVPISGNGCYSAEKFATNLLWDLCNITERMLLQSVEHRSYGISIFLPIIFKTFDSRNSLEISVDGHTCILSRDIFFKKIWNCCRTLFSLGATERRDAYNILSLCLPSSCPGLEYADRSGREEEFDLRAEKEFWTEIKRGLVDEEGIIRKQSLHILKMVAQVSGENQCYTGVSEKKSQEQHPVNKTMTKRERWAAKEAKSLGVGKLSKAVDPGLKGQQQWEAFILLYEMLEEYGTHLVEAAWNHQVTVLLQFYASYDSLSTSIAGVHQSLVRSSVDIFDWLSILWERGFRHGNPQVRCIIMQSFLAIEWKIHGEYAKSVPESFVLGPFMEGLNDPVHHKEFGVKGVYCSKTIEAAAQFVHEYTSKLNPRKRVSFLSNLAYVAKRLSFGRVGLMALAECIASAACGAGNHNGSEKELPGDVSLEEVQEKSFVQNIPSNDQSDLLDVLRFVIENSKQHFNPSYRLQVCQKVLEAAVSLVRTFEVPLEILLHFISVLPQEFTDYGGSLRASVQNWLLGCGKQHSANCCKSETLLLENLLAFPKNYIRHLFLDDAFVTYDDEDLSAWEFEARRWARVFFLVITEEHHLAPILKFIEEHGIDICKQNNLKDRIPVKFLIFALALVLEIQIMQERKAECGIRVRTRSKVGSMETVDLFTFRGAPIFLEKLASLFSHVLEGLVSFARLSCTIFSSLVVTEATSLPSSVRGKLGGPSQRRLSSSITTTVLQAVVSVKAVASITSWCAQFKTDASLESAYDFMWSFFGKTITSPTSDSETGAEVHLAAYEALASVLKGLISPQALNFISENDKLMLPAFDGRPWLDSWLLTFLQNINAHLAVGVLARTRRAILMNWKWLCLESLLSLPYHVLEVGENVSSFVSDAAVRCVYDDLVESLENAGEGSVLPMLRSIRLTHWLLGSGMLCSVDSTCNGVNSQMMWNLVRSSWILHVSCNKRRVAPIAALLSAVLHPSLFSNEVMHAENEPGPLKWFVENVLEEGTRSPRTIRLAALQLTGLWLSNPKIIKYYMKELKLLTLYGSVAFDEDFEAELAGNLDAKAEVSFLAKSPDPELTEAFINTELYARVSVAVMFYKLGEMVESANMNENCQASLAAGKLFLLELLHFVVNDKDLARELYKKYSAIHRRKVRAWQMICVLSRFVDNEIVGQVTHLLHLSLYRNNLPAVRQYLETFAINIYLKFPSLVEEQLVPILRDYDMRPQALASYVFVAANIILHASKEFQSRHLDELLPPIIPLLTSHHHSLRGFAQLLIYQVLCKLFPSLESATFKIIPLEKRSFEELKLYLAKNSDCARLRASMEGYLDAYDPSLSTTPAGIFINRVEELEFECVPTSLMEQVLSFLNDVREDLRCSMAKDTVTIKNESLKVGDDMDSKVCNGDEENSYTQQPRGPSLDFQKKITPSHEKQDKDFRSLIEDRDRSNQLLEMEKEDELFERVLQSRSVAMQKTRASQQHFFLVASFIDRIPNLAGLARTCEVFKASGLAIADASILHDKQFQLISVTAEKWIPVIEVPVNSVKLFLERKKREGYSILGLEQTANSISLDHYNFPKRTVLVLGREKEGIPVDIIHMLDACIEIRQMGVVRSLNVHVSGAIALWEYTRQHRS